MGQVKIRAHLTDEEDQGDNEEDGPEEIQMEIFDQEEPGETAEEVAKEQDVIFSRIEQSYTSNIKSRDVVKYEPHPGCPGHKCIWSQHRVQDHDHGRGGSNM